MFQVLHEIALVLTGCMNKAIDENQLIFSGVMNQITDKRSSHIIIGNLPNTSGLHRILVVYLGHFSEHGQVCIVDAHIGIVNIGRYVLPQRIAQCLDVLSGNLGSILVGLLADKNIIADLVLLQTIQKTVGSPIALKYPLGIRIRIPKLA